MFDQKKLLIPANLLSKFEIQKYYENELDLMGFILEIIYLTK